MPADLPSNANAPLPLRASEVGVAIARARRFSLYVARLLTASPDLLESIDLCAPCTVATGSQRATDKPDLYRQLRTLRQRTMGALIVRDLAGWATLAEVTQTMTALAQVSIQTALDWMTEDLSAGAGIARNAQGEVQQLIVVGMGKLGGAELNVSSDIDLVFVYPDDGDSDGPRPLSNHEYFSRVGRGLIAALAEPTEDGFVFRVDMRLRPYGDSGPLAMSFNMLENYLITQGREWERYAWIKARALTGATRDHTALMALVRPFIYRRHLDYSAFASMRELHSQIRREAQRRENSGHADDIKLGRGGIREIEFAAQLFQLIRGGHDAGLRRQPTLEVLALLGEREQMPTQVIEALSQAYVFLRNLEHRLQYRDDQQTHSLPADATTRDAIAISMGHVDYASLLRMLDAHRNRVSRQFDSLFANNTDRTQHHPHPLAALWTHADDATAVVQQLRALGFARPDDLQSRLAQMHGSARYRQMPATSQARIDRLAPCAIEAAAAGAWPDATLERLLSFLEQVSRRESYLALLEEYPQARTHLAELMRASPWVAQYLTLHPILLDELLDARTLHAAPDWPALAQGLRATLSTAEGDTEKQMDVLRHFKHAQTLRLIAQDLSGRLSLETLSDHLSDLACTVLHATLHAVWRALGHHNRAQPAFAIIGYGKLGGKELGYASDLDLVFLYAESTPDAAESVTRFAQRINTWLTSTTPAGLLYETDLRLRPDGESGLLVSTLGGFRHYQESQAWLWEHQALTRARFVAGDAAVGAKFEALRDKLLRRPRELSALRQAISAMREKMHAAHPNRSSQFDVKHDRGGIVDVEFIVQYLVLGFAHQHDSLTGNIGNLALLRLAAALKLIPTAQSQSVQQSYRFWRQTQHTRRLQGERYVRIAMDEAATHSIPVCKLWQSVFGNSR